MVVVDCSNYFQETEFNRKSQGNYRLQLRAAQRWQGLSEMFERILMSGGQEEEPLKDCICA